MKISLRNVLKNDWDFILLLRNEEKFKIFFNTQHVITKKEHYEYLKKHKSNPKFVNRIICYGKKDVGYIRILDNDISIMVLQKFHGKGIGTKALELMEEEAKKLGIKKLIGNVMVHNNSSKKIFLKNNFKLKMYSYEKEI